MKTTQEKNNKYFAVIDTETNWDNKVMSIGVVVANADTFEICDKRYHIITPEYSVGGMFSSVIYNHPTQYGVAVSREAAIEDTVKFLDEYEVKSIFAYNASFDYKLLPELHNYQWYDIMRIAAYKQYNDKINEDDCHPSGRLKRNYGVESMARLLVCADYCEKHNALDDAMDELLFIMKPLNRKIEDYIPLGTENKSSSKTAKSRRRGVIERSFTLTAEDDNGSYEILRPQSNDFALAARVLTKNSNNQVILKCNPSLLGIAYIKASNFSKGKVEVIAASKADTVICSKEMSLIEFLKFLVNFENRNEFDIAGWNIVS